MRYVLYVALTLFLVLSSTANAQVAGLIERALSGDGRIVTVTGFSGLLSTRSTIEKLTIADEEGVWLTLDGAVLEWDAGALLNGTLDVTELSATRLVVARAPVSSETAGPPEAQASGFRIPDLPVSVRIGMFQIPNVELGESLLGEAVTAQLDAQASLSGGGANITLTATRKDLRQTGRINLGLMFDPETEQLSVTAQLDEPPAGVVARALSLPGLPSVALSVQGKGPLDAFVADIALNTDGVDRLSGQVTLERNPSADQRAFSADIRGDIRPLLTGDARDFFGHETGLRADGIRQDDGAFELRDLTLETNALTLSGAAKTSVEGALERLSLTGALQAEGQVTLPGSAVSVKTGDLRIFFDAANGPEWELHADLKSLQGHDFSVVSATLTGAGLYQPNTEMLVSGTLDLALAGVKTGDPALNEALRPLVRLTTDLNVKETGQVQLNKLMFSTPYATLSGSASARPQEGRVALAVEGQLDVPDLAKVSELIAPVQTGAITADATLTAELPGGTIAVSLSGSTRDIKLGIDQLDLLLRPETQLLVKAQRDDTGTHLQQLELINPELTAQGSGSISQTTSNVRFDAKLRDIRVFEPRLQGPLSLKVAASGPLTAQDFSVDFELPGTVVADLDGTYSARASQERSINARASVSLPQLNTFSGFSSLIEGGQAQADLGAVVDLDKGTSELALTASTRRISVSNTMLNDLLSAPAQLTASLSRASDGTVQVQDLVLKNSEISASAQASLSPDSSSATLDAVLRDLGRFVPQLPGQLQMKVSATDLLGAPVIEGTVKSATGLDANVNGQVNLPNGTIQLDALGSAPLALATPFIGNRAVSGRADFDLSLRGKPGLDALSGGISTKNARISDPDLGLIVSPLSAQVEISQAKAVLNALAQIGSGRAELTGGLGLTGSLPLNLDVDVKALPYAFQDILRTTVDGALNIAGPASRRLSVSGDLALSGTTIRVPDTGLGNTSPIPVIRHVGAKPGVRRTQARANVPSPARESETPSLSIPIDLRVDARDPIFLRGRGVDAEFAGQVRIGGTVRDPIPVGQFDLKRGRLSFLGQRLDITEGAITAAGRLVPRLDIVAESASSDVTAQINLAGPADAPQISLSSTPDLPEDEILARLLFGRSAATLSPFQVAKLISSLSQIAGNGPGLLEETRGAFGFNDLDIRTDARTGETELAIGQYIGEHVYSEFEFGEQGRTQLNLNLDVTDRTTVKGSVNSVGETGVGVFWERDY